MPRYPKKSIAERANDAYEHAYHTAVLNLNRHDRRTALGRQIVAEAKAKALEAKVSVLEAAIEELKGGM